MTNLTIEHNGKPVAQQWFTRKEVQQLLGTTGWQPIASAPRDNKRLLYLARFDAKGKLVELDFDGIWEYWQESYEMPHINGWCWMSANGIEEPTHWAYQSNPFVAPPST